MRTNVRSALGAAIDGVAVAVAAMAVGLLILWWMLAL
jgi:hypothetical protein